MKTFLVPMFAIVKAHDADGAIDQAGGLCGVHPEGSVLQDETLDPVEFDPATFEPHSILDVFPNLVKMPSL